MALGPLERDEMDPNGLRRARAECHTSSLKLCVLVVTAAKAAASTASDLIAVGLALASIAIYWWSWPSALFKPKA